MPPTPSTRVTRKGVCPRPPRIPARIDEVAVPAHGRVGGVFYGRERPGLSLAKSSPVSRRPPPAASIRRPACSPTCDAIWSIDMDFS